MWRTSVKLKSLILIWWFFLFSFKNRNSFFLSNKKTGKTFWCQLDSVECEHLVDDDVRSFEPTSKLGRRFVGVVDFDEKVSEAFGRQLVDREVFRLVVRPVVVQLRKPGWRKMLQWDKTSSIKLDKISLRQARKIPRPIVKAISGKAHECMSQDSQAPRPRFTCYRGSLE